MEVGLLEIKGLRYSPTHIGNYVIKWVKSNTRKRDY